MTKEILIEPEAPAPAKEPVRDDRCETCKAGCFNRTSPDGECRMNPPTHQIFLVPGQDALRRPSIGTTAFAAWPPVKRTNWCLKWQPKIEH